MRNDIFARSSGRLAAAGSASRPGLSGMAARKRVGVNFSGAPKRMRQMPGATASTGGAEAVVPSPRTVVATIRNATESEVKPAAHTGIANDLRESNHRRILERGILNSNSPAAVVKPQEFPDAHGRSEQKLPG